MLLRRKIGHEPFPLASRHSRVRALEPFFELIDGQAADPV